MCHLVERIHPRKTSFVILYIPKCLFLLPCLDDLLTAHLKINQTLCFLYSWSYNVFAPHSFYTGSLPFPTLLYLYYFIYLFSVFPAGQY